MSIKDFRLWALMFFVAMLVMLCAPVWATGKDNDNSVNVDNEVTVGGSTVSVEAPNVSTGGVSTGGNKSIALGNVLGDVDIAQCLGSTQWSTPVYGKQKLSLNWVCVAEFYIRFQQPELAAMALCNTEIVKEFGSEQECEEAHHFLVQTVEPALPDDDEDDVRYQQTLMMQQELEYKVAELEALMQRSQRPVRQVVQKGLTPEQKALLREVVK